MVLSILHRGTGLFLVFGTVMIVLWVITLSLGHNIFASYQSWLGSLLGKALLVGWSFSLFYHLINGIRHLVWDAGWGYEIETAYITGWIVILLSFFLTGVLWLLPVLG